MNNRSMSNRHVFSNVNREIWIPVQNSSILNIAAGTAVRFEPGDIREVELVALAGERKVFGLNNKVDALLD